MNTLHQVKTLIAAQCGLGVDEIGDDQPLSNDAPGGLDLDSLDRLELVMKLEDHFCVEIPDADADRPALGTAAGIAAYLDGDGITHATRPEAIMGEAVDYINMETGDMIAAIGLDAERWAEAFCQLNWPGIARSGRADAKDTLRSWFANAIEIARDNPRVEMIDPDSPEARHCRFRKLPVEIDAVNFKGIIVGAPHFNVPPEAFPEWLLEALAGPDGHAGSAWVSRRQIDKTEDEWKDGLSIGTLEGNHFATAGDWIIRGVYGEIYPCKPDIFAKIYEPARPGRLTNAVALEATVEAVKDRIIAAGPDHPYYEEVATERVEGAPYPAQAAPK